MKNQVVLVGGNFRGGTSVVTRLIVAAGYRLPGSFGKNYEDLRLQRELRQVKKPSRQKLKKLFEQNNSEYPNWVAKYPAIFLHFKTMLPLLDKPKVVLIIRDPLAVAQSEKRNQQKKELEKVLERPAIYNQKMIQAYKKYGSKYSFLLLSYEKLITKPLETCTALCAFINKGKPDEVVRLITHRETTPWPVEANLSPVNKSPA